MGTEVFGGGVVDVFWGAVDAIAPALDDSKSDIITAGVWSEIGEGFIDEDGLNADFANTTNKVFVLRSTAAQRIYRTQEEPMVEFNLFESTIEAMAIGLHGADTGTGSRITNPETNTKRVAIKRGSIVQESAILFRTVSPYDTNPAVNGWLLQGYFPRGIFEKIGSYKYYKEQVALPLTFASLESLTNDLGWIEAQFEA